METARNSASTPFVTTGAVAPLSGTTTATPNYSTTTATGAPSGVASVIAAATPYLPASATKAIAAATPYLTTSMTPTQKPYGHSAGSATPYLTSSTNHLPATTHSPATTHLPAAATHALLGSKLGGTTAGGGVVPRVEQAMAARFFGSGSGDRRSHGEGRSVRFSGDGRRGSGTSDDTELSKRILDIHESDDRGLAVKPVLHIIDVIFYRATADLPGYSHELQSDVASDEKVLYSAASLQDYVEIPVRITSSISSEIFTKCSAGVDVHTIVMDILHLVKHYSWESKAVLALVAFSVTFGEFRLVLQLSPTNSLAKALSLLKQLPEILEHANALRPKLDALYTLIKEILDVTKKIVEFYELPRDYFSSESPEILAAVSHIPTAVYWAIRGIVVSTTQILALTGMGIEYLTEPWELSSLAHKLNNIKGHLVNIIERCYSHIDRQKEDESFEMIVRTFSTTHIDNTKPLTVLFKSDPQSLYDCYNKRRVTIEEYRRKVVAFFITGIEPDLTQSTEYTILQQMYAEKRHSPTRPESQYEVIWVPVSDLWTEERRARFNSLKEQMEWHSINDPLVITKVVMRFFREKWNVTNKPMLVVMDHQGRIVHHNAIHMMCIWGSQAYPFTTNREKLLWEETNWTIDLIIDGFEPSLPTWIGEGRYICLYGGDDIEWIRKFTRVAKEVARESGISLELLYVGKSKSKERTTRTIIDQIVKENMSRTLDWNLIWYFWIRLQCMWHSKGQLVGIDSVKNDQIMQGIIAMLSYGSSGQGWAVISRGYNEMTKASGEHMFQVLTEHGRWRPREADIGFVPALDEHLRGVLREAPHHCTTLELPATGAMPDTVACAECGRIMERFTMFRCCLD